MPRRCGPGIRTSVRTRPQDQRSLVPALVDGDDAGLRPDLEADFRTTGLTHLTAVSGTNLTLVVGFLIVVARWCRVRGRWLLLVGAAGIVGFVLLARTEPSVVRAAVMGTVGLLALGVNGRHRALRALGVAVVVLLLLAPALAVSVGFALSVAGDGGHRAAGAALARRAGPVAAAVVRRGRRGAGGRAAGLHAAGRRASPGRSAWSRWRPTCSSPRWWAPPRCWAWPAGSSRWSAPRSVAAIGWLAATCVAWIVVVARQGAALPAAALDWGTGPAPLAVLVLLCAVTALGAHRLLRRPVTGLACGAGGRGGGRGPAAHAGLARRRLGDGDVRRRPGRRGGRPQPVRRPGWWSTPVPTPRRSTRCLDRLDVRQVPLVVLTHFHADHVDGLPGVLEGRAVGAVETTRTARPDHRGAADRRHGEPRAGWWPAPPAFGTTRAVGDVRCRSCGPGRARVTGSGDGSRPTTRASCCWWRSQGLRLLLTGDVEPPGQAALARLVPALGHVDVLKVPHHGSRYQDLAWLASLDADVALVSVGADNDYGHPAADVLDALARGGAEVHRTDEEGDLLVLATPSGPEVRARDP